MNTNESKQTLLIVEDDEGLQKQLRWCFDGDYNVEIAGDRESAVNMVRKTTPQVITLDLGLPPDPANVSEGMKTLEKILAISPDTKIIVVTGNDDRKHALDAISLGAYDFYQKPVEPEVLKIIIERAFYVYNLEKENKNLIGRQNTLEGVIANSPQMIKVCRDIEKIANVNVTTLVLGESGTGKELIARNIHDNSQRANNKFVAINCAAIPENLLESELFGYEKGAFTGATKQTIGKIEYANKGTLFLDEIGDLPFNLQAKLLRFLQERTIERIGGRNEIPVDVRVICATHQNLSDMIENNTFREDLFYRLSEVTIKIPPLRERVGDSILLAKYFLEKYKAEYKKNIRGFTGDTLRAIDEYVWPGNVREIENKVKRAVIMSEHTSLTVDDMELESVVNKNTPINLRDIREKAEIDAIIKALKICDGNIVKTSSLLGVSRPTLYDMLKKYNIPT